MKKIGLIGGMSWESTALYYRIINETVKQQRGGLHSARLVLESLDFAEIEHLQHVGNWEGAGKILGKAARSLELAGADFLILCTNTMHKIASAIEAEVAIPLLQIADATADEILRSGNRKIGLLGTAFTMEQSFYRDRLVAQGLTVLVPNQDDRGIVHRIIYEELCIGIVQDKSRLEYRRIIQELVDNGAQAIILGCTEISLLIGDGDSSVPLFDTTAIHARRAVKFALETEEH
jgi:aspartate racemase